MPSMLVNIFEGRFKENIDYLQDTVFTTTIENKQFFADCEKLKNSKMQSALPTELIIAIPPGSEDVMWNHLFYYFFQNFPQIKLIRKYFNYTKSTKEYLLEHPSEVGITHVLPTELTDFGKQINYYHLDTCKLYFLSTNEEYRDLKTISINSIKNKHIILGFP